jgi:hypothetical protein
VLCEVGSGVVLGGVGASMTRQWVFVAVGVRVVFVAVGIGDMAAVPRRRRWC